MTQNNNVKTSTFFLIVGKRATDGKVKKRNVRNWIRGKLLETGKKNTVVVTL